MRIKDAIRLYVTGFTMGTADLIPGVSGGTIAFVSGIYEELIQAIKTVSGQTLRLALRLKFGDAARTVPWKFLVPLLLGLGTAVLALAGLVTFLLDNHPVYVWAFFFGLVAASTYIVAKRVVRWDGHDYLAFAATAFFAYFLVGGGSVELGHSPLNTFLSGAIAICAMILPGISGSFILVLLGQYHYILDSLHERDLVTIVIFITGCAIGLSAFSRVLSWLFRRHHDISVAALAGFMLGSLRKIWPFGTAENAANPWIWILAVAGLAAVMALDRMQALKEKTSDLDDPEFTLSHEESLDSQK